MHVDAIDIVRLCFLGTAAAVLLVHLVPDLRSRFLAYGARSSTASTSSAEREKEHARQKTWLVSFLDQLAALRVPHSWFITFYVLSVSLSVFWLLVLPVARLQINELLAFNGVERASTPFSRLLLSMLLLLAQGSRRLAECLFVSAPSSSTMWFGHWLIGLGFYAGMSVAIWVEGFQALLSHDFSFHDLEIEMPGIRTFFSVLTFILASGIQHDCHAYLASLKRPSQKQTVKPASNAQNATERSQTYRLPTHPAFTNTFTPHYLAECFIYISLSFLAAPEGQWVNGTLICALVFVMTNLGVTAAGTYGWYKSRFGQKAIERRWAMIPLIY